MHPLGHFDPRQPVGRRTLQMKQQKELIHGDPVNGGELARKTGPEVIGDLQQAESICGVYIGHANGLLHVSCVCKHIAHVGQSCLFGLGFLQ